MPALPAFRGRVPLVAQFTVGAVCILAGASFNVQGHTGRTGVLVMLGGLMAVGAGILHARWRIAIILGLVSIILVFAGVPVEGITTLSLTAVGFNLLGLSGLLIGGLLGSLAYQEVMGAMQGRLKDLEALNRDLEEQHRIFLAATDETHFQEADDADRAASTALQMGAAFCCYYLATPDGHQYAPQGLGYGFELVRPQAVDRNRDLPLLKAVEKDEDFLTLDRRDLMPLVRFMPPDFEVANALAVPLRVGDHVEGFILAGNKARGFSADDRRLARTLAMRAGIGLANAHAVALSQKEAGRYAVLNDLVKEASGRGFEEAMQLVLERGHELLAYDAARIAVFSADASYLLLGASEVPAPVRGTSLAEVLTEGRTVLRRMVTQENGLFSGFRPGEGVPVSEALTPIRGKGEVFGALCLGRRGATSFSEADVGALEELGTMVGVVVENSRILQQVSGQATRLDSALDALGEVSKALVTTTQGRSILERQALQAAARVAGCRHALMTRVAGDGIQRISTGLGFPLELRGETIKNGQGLVGAVMLSGAPVSVSDMAESFDLASPPDLGRYGVQGAICVPLMDGGQLRGTMSVFATERRAWSEDDVRVLTTMANATVVALKNAELFDSSRKMVWELNNLHEGLRAATSTLDLDHVLELVLGWAARASEAQIGCIALEEAGKLELVGSYGTDHATAGRLALGLGSEICLEVMETREPFMDAMEKPAGHTLVDSPLEPRAVLCVPISLRDQAIGVLFLANYVTARPFNADHRRLITALAAQAAVAIDNARLFKDREEVILSALNALAAAVDARDPYTAGHSSRVAEYSLRIARQMKYGDGDEAALRRLRQGCLLHDIGKIGVADAVLQKAGPLTKGEFDQMKSHPVVGYDILKGLKMLSDELVIVRSHHERYDGRGYPDGRSGDHVPMCAWIVSAADAIDAITSDRPYRQGRELSVALKELSEGAGSQFHPEVVAAVKAAAAAGRLDLIRDDLPLVEAEVARIVEHPVR